MSNNKSTLIRVGNVIAKDSDIKVLDACIKASRPALLIGETGTGKTSLLREIANLKKKKLVRVSVNGSMGIEEIIGKHLAKDGSTYWQDGVLTEAVRTGNWVVFDEINAALPEILFSLHSLLDDDRKLFLQEKDGEVVSPHKSFRFFATMNPTEDYEGTKEMNKALLSRFSAVLKISPIPEEHEHRFIDELIPDGDRKEEFINTLFGIAGDIRKLKEEGRISHYPSMRDLVQASELFMKGLTPWHAICHAVINKMSGYDLIATISHLEDKGIIDGDELKDSYPSFKGIASTVDYLKESNRQLEEKVSMLNNTIKNLKSDLSSSERLLEIKQNIVISLEKKVKELQEKINIISSDAIDKILGTKK